MMHNWYAPKILQVGVSSNRFYIHIHSFAATRECNGKCICERLSIQQRQIVDSGQTLWYVCFKHNVTSQKIDMLHHIMHITKQKLLSLSTLSFVSCILTSFIIVRLCLASWTVLGTYVCVMHCEQFGCHASWTLWKLSVLYRVPWTVWTWPIFAFFHILFIYLPCLRHTVWIMSVVCHASWVVVKTWSRSNLLSKLWYPFWHVSNILIQYSCQELTL